MLSGCDAYSVCCSSLAHSDVQFVSHGTLALATPVAGLPVNVTVAFVSAEQPSALLRAVSLMQRVRPAPASTPSSTTVASTSLTALIVTRNVQAAWLVQRSVAVHVTVVTPTGKLDPLAG